MMSLIMTQPQTPFNNSADSQAQTPQLDHASWSRIWHLSWPIMISNLSQPLVGATDTAMMGHLADPALIGGVALGTVVIHFLLMIFGFLRMSTTAMTSQAQGGYHVSQADITDVQRPLQRGILIGLSFGCLFILASPLVIAGATMIMPASAEVEAYMADYIAIQIFALPALLMNAALLGWLYGLQSMRLGMVQLLLINGLNISLNIVFVLGFDGGIKGVALASVIANWIGFLFVCAMIHRRFAFYISGILKLRYALSRTGWSAYGALSRDIMIRTILLYLVQVSLLYAGGREGDIPLAALQLIIVIFGLVAYSLDGFAHASEALVGAAIGAKQKSSLRTIIWRSTTLAALASFVMSFALWLFADELLGLLTVHDAVIAQSLLLWPYVLMLAPAAFLAFQMDGIFIGAAYGRALRNGMMISFITFIGALALFAQFTATSGLDGVLLAFILYLMTRGVSLVIKLPDIIR